MSRKNSNPKFCFLLFYLFIHVKSIDSLFEKQIIVCDLALWRGKLFGDCKTRIYEKTNCYIEQQMKIVAVFLHFSDSSTDDIVFFCREKQSNSEVFQDFGKKFTSPDFFWDVSVKVATTNANSTNANLHCSKCKITNYF